MGEEIHSEDESNSDNEADEEDCPIIRLSREEKHRIRAPWMKSLVLKVLGRRVGMVSLADLHNDFYLARFNNDEDYDIGLFGGPWLVLITT